MGQYLYLIACQGYDYAMRRGIPIDELVASSAGFVLASDKANAYRGFSDGQILIAEDPEILESFAKENSAEFWGDQIERHANGSFRYFESGGNRFYFTYHKHKAREEFVRRLQEVEMGNPPTD
jgi:hypothetical protein